MSPEQLVGAWLLASARLWPLLQVQASWRAAAGPSWTWIAPVFAAAFAALALLAEPGLARSATVTAEPLSFAFALAFEALLGGALGLGLSLPGWALVGAARESEASLGIVEAEGRSGSLARCLITASLAGGLALGLHLPMLAGGLDLLARFELGDPRVWLPAAEAAPRWLAELSLEAGSLALALATPVLLLRVLCELVVASFARGGTREAFVAGLAPGLRLGLALLVLGAAWSSYPEGFARGM